MLNLTAIQAATYELTPTTSRLPPVVWKGFSYLNQVHGLWRWYRRMDLYRQPESLAQLLIGKGVSYLIGNIELVRVAAQCVLVATRLLECAQQQAVLWQAGCDWLETCRGNYQFPSDVTWSKNHDHFFSPSTVHWWKTQGSYLCERIHLIAVQTWRLLGHAFLLSMRMMDVLDALYCNPNVRQEAMDESMINIIKCMNSLVENKVKLLSTLEQNRQLIERLLKGSPLNYKKLHNAVEGACSGAEMIYYPLKRVSELGGQTLSDMASKIFGRLKAEG